jgi:hypothetical protein
MKTRRLRLTYANVISTLSLFLVLGGGAYAASTLPKHSVGTKQLQAAAVTPAKLSSAAKATLTGPTGAAGAKGAQGERGERGEKGQQGEHGLNGERGPVGPTEGFVAGNPPGGAAELDLVTESISLSQPGRLFVTGSGKFGFTCPVGAVETGLYVDGVGLPGSIAVFASGVETQLTMVGMTSGTIAAGPHQIVIGARCTSGTIGGGGVSRTGLDAILLGA